MNRENSKERQRMGNDGSTAQKSPAKEHRRERPSGSTDGSTSKSPENQKKRRTKKDNAPRGTSAGTTNPFLVFFLRMRSKKPNEPVTVIARKAGRLWAKMTPTDRKKYVDLANAAKQRRLVKQIKKQPKNKEPEPTTTGR